VGDFLKSISSLIFAGVILLGILFLPEANFGWLHDFLSMLANSQNTAVSFGYYLVQKFITGAAVIGVTILLGIAAKRAYERR